MSLSQKTKYLLLVIFIACVVSVFYLRLFGKWWFEDDPDQFARAADIHHAFDIFTDREIMNHWGAGQALVPMQIFSYWIDVRLAGYSTFFAYFHSIFSFLATASLFYLVIFQFFKNEGVSFWTLILWILLPSTIATHHYLATRHYIEGFFFSLVSIYLCSKAIRDDWKEIFCIPLIGLAMILAMLSKEIYASILPLFLLVYSIQHRKFWITLLTILTVIIYLIYRTWMLGPDLSYTVPFLGFKDYVKFIWILPYTLTSNRGGYFIYFIFLVISAFSLFTLNKSRRTAAIFLLVLYIISLATIYPVSWAVLNAYGDPGTWYRAVFLVNTLILVGACYLLNQSYLPKLQIIFFFAAASIILPGTERTHKLWDHIYSGAEMEGKFYLSNPDKLLYSEENAWWFIIGLEEMYNIENEHYVSIHFIKSDHTKEMLGSYPTIWKREGNGYKPDPQFYDFLLIENGLSSKKGGQ